MKIFTFLLFGIGLFSYSVSAQTKLVKDINPGTEDGVSAYESILYKGKIFFCGGVSTSNQELWVSDGTNDGTKLVKDLMTGSSGTPRGFKIFLDTLFFEDWLGNYWKSDGTTDNTIKLNTKFPYWDSKGAGFSKDLFLDAIVGGYWDKDWIVTKDRNGNIIDTLQEGSSILNTIIYKGNLYFFGTRKVTYIGYTEHECFLSKTNGTKKGTEVILDKLTKFDPQMVIVNNKLLFNLPKINGIEPYISDGTKEGTKLLFDINPDADNSSPYGFISNGKIALFTAYEGIHGSAVWRTDGTTEGTYLLYDWFNNTSENTYATIKPFYIDTLFYISIKGRYELNTIVTNGKNFVKELELGFDYGKCDILENLSTSKYIVVSNKLRSEYDKCDYEQNDAYFKVFGIDSISNILNLNGSNIYIPNSYEINNKVVFDNDFTTYGKELGYLDLKSNHIPQIDYDSIYVLKDSMLNNKSLFEFKKYDKDGDTLTYVLKEVDCRASYWYNNHDFELIGNKLYYKTGFNNSGVNSYFIDVYVSDGKLENHKKIKVIVIDSNTDDDNTDDDNTDDDNTDDSTTDIPVTANNSDFVIFPNPCQSSFRIESNENNGIVKIYTVNGELISASPLDLNSYNLPQKGIYLINIMTKKGCQINKIISTGN